MIQAILILIAVGLLCLLLGDLLIRRRRHHRHLDDSREITPPHQELVEYDHLLSQLRPTPPPDGDRSKPHYLVLDFQTTGLSTVRGNEARIVQAAWLILDSSYQDLGHGIVLVSQPDAGSSEARQVHHLDSETIQALGITEEKLLNKLLPLIAQAEVIVCHNVRFDLSILLGTVRRIRPEAEEWIVRKRALCTMVLSAALETPAHSYLSLISLASSYTGIDPSTLGQIDVVGSRNVVLTRVCLMHLCQHHPDETAADRLPLVAHYISGEVS